MESVPVPVEVTSVPEEVTPKGATLPVEASTDAVLENMLTESTLLSETSLKGVPDGEIPMETVPTDTTCTDKASLDKVPATPSKATDTNVEETPPLPESPVEATSTEEAVSSKANASRDSIEAPLNTSTASPLEGTSLNVAPTETSATPAKTLASLAQSTSKSGSPNSTPSSRSRKRKFCPDAVTVPFEMGWMREMVHRGTEGKIGQKQSDIYYFTPEGIKLRSMVEIGNYLSKHSECTLTLDNFTFAKQCVYREPFEIERSAKQKSILSNLPTFYKTKIVDRSKEMDAVMKQSPIKKFAPPLPSLPKLSIKSVSQGQVEKKFTCVLLEPNNSSKNNKSAAMIHNKSPSGSVDSNAPSAKKFKASFEKQSFSEIDSSSQSSGGNIDIAHIQSTFKQKLGGSKKNNSVTQSRAKLKSSLPKIIETYRRPCSFHCAVSRFQNPQIRCALCYCLFHQHCVPRLAYGIEYACKSCISSKLALYESITNPNQIGRPPEQDEEEQQDIPLNLEVSLLFPDIQLEESNCELKVHYSMVNKTKSGSVEITNFSRMPAAANPVPPMPVPYMPCLVNHLLRPSSPSHPGSKQSTPLLPSQQVQGGNSLVSNRISAVLPATNRAPILVRCSPSGRTIVRSAVVLNTQTSANPLSALKTLSQDVGTSPNWTGVPSPLSFSAQNLSVKRNPDCNVNSSPGFSAQKITGHNEVSPVIQQLSVPSRVNDSILAASLKGRTTSVYNYTYVKQSAWDVASFSTSEDCLKLVFKMLDVCDLLRVGQVCKSWNHLSTQSFLWENVKFSNLMVTSWSDCCLFLKKAGTKCLDFQGIVHPSQEFPFDSLENYISMLSNVEEVIFDEIPSSLLQSIALNLHQLKKLECHFVTDAVVEEEMWNSACTFKLSTLQGLNRLTKLKLNSGGRVILKCDPEYLMPFLPNLRHLTLTGFKFGSHINLECLSMHKELISLELGDCSDVEPEVYALLGSLKKLRCLRLENGGSLQNTGFVDCLQNMTKLEILELMNFRIPNNFEEAFKHFKNLIHLNIWPDTTYEGPVINTNLFQALTHCEDLAYACWGVITEEDDTPDTLTFKNYENETKELSYEELFHKLVEWFPECRVEVKCVPRKSWREFCCTRD